MRAPFLTRPGLWTKAPRTAQSPVDFACSVEAHRKGRRDTFVDIAVALMFVGTLVLIALGAL